MTATLDRGAQTAAWWAVRSSLHDRLHQLDSEHTFPALPPTGLANNLATEIVWLVEAFKALATTDVDLVEQVSKQCWSGTVKLCRGANEAFTRDDVTLLLSTARDLHDAPVEARS